MEICLLTVIMGQESQKTEGSFQQQPNLKFPIDYRCEIEFADDICRGWFQLFV